MLFIGDKVFHNKHYTQEVYDLLRAFARSEASRGDDPIKRFIARRLKGLSGQDRRDALAGWMLRDDWDAPPETAVNAIMSSRLGACILLANVIDPAMSDQEIRAIVTEENKTEIIRQIVTSNKPSDEDIVRANQYFRERIEKNHAKAE